MVSFVTVKGKIVLGIFQKRLNRFLAFVKVKEKILFTFLPNPGRMRELLVPGTKVILVEALNPNRKTSYDLIGVCARSKSVY